MSAGNISTTTCNKIVQEYHFAIPPLTDEKAEALLSDEGLTFDSFGEKKTLQLKLIDSTNDFVIKLFSPNARELPSSPSFEAWRFQREESESPQVAYVYHVKRISDSQVDHHETVRFLDNTLTTGQKSYEFEWILGDSDSDSFRAVSPVPMENHPDVVKYIESPEEVSLLKANYKRVFAGTSWEKMEQSGLFFKNSAAISIFQRLTPEQQKRTEEAAHQIATKSPKLIDALMKLTPTSLVSHFSQEISKKPAVYFDLFEKIFPSVLSAYAKSKEGSDLQNLEETSQEIEKVIGEGLLGLFSKLFMNQEVRTLIINIFAHMEQEERERVFETLIDFLQTFPGMTKQLIALDQYRQDYVQGLGLVQQILSEYNVYELALQFIQLISPAAESNLTELLQRGAVAAQKLQVQREKLESDKKVIEEDKEKYRSERDGLDELRAQIEKEKAQLETDRKLLKKEREKASYENAEEFKNLVSQRTQLEQEKSFQPQSSKFSYWALGSGILLGNLMMYVIQNYFAQEEY